MIDQKLLFSDAQALTGTANSTNIIDESVASEMGQAHLRAFIAITAKGASTPTIQINIVGADDSGFSTNKITIGQTGTLSDPALDSYDIPLRSHARKRFYRAEYTLGGGGGSPTFTVTCGLTDALQTQLKSLT